jgi:biotin-dependent carboxylase-like uncharacterized protein
MLPGQVLDVGVATSGLRSYSAIAGGIVVPSVLGSCSTDLLGGLGPAPLAVGDRLPLGLPVGLVPPIDFVASPGILQSPVLKVVEGPRVDWFEPEAMTILMSTPWTVSPDSNRIGLRLHGAVPLPLRRPTQVDSQKRRGSGQLPPEGLTTGSVQVPANGQPLIFLHDHPATGGYPVIAVLTDDSIGVAAQAVPGSTLRFEVRSQRK